MSAIIVNIEIDKAMILIKPHLSKFKKGDDIVFDWIKETGKIEKPARLYKRLEKYFRGCDPVIFIQKRGATFHLLTTEEQVIRSGNHVKKGYRQQVRAYTVNVNTPRAELAPQRAAAFDRERFRLERNLQTHEKDRKEERSLISSPTETRPQLKAASETNE